MWQDVETTQDLLNFTVVAETAAKLIQESKGFPLSIGVSGQWGTGKSSLVKMIGESLKLSDPDGKDFIFLEFNAWLYQGYEDARIALLQMVADHLLQEAERREKCVDKAKSFISRINWFRVAKLAAPSVTGAVMGGAVGGPVGAVVGAVGGLFKGQGTPSEEDLQKVKEAYENIEPQLKGLLKDKEMKSLPKEIAVIRELFADILKELNVTLVVLVDDLDRCLPPTAISTLEAMRLLLFLPGAAFIIAADEQMIKSAVRYHFGDRDLDDDLVTSYFDKLIQVPFKVPRLGVTEVKAYLILLLADLAQRKGKITNEACQKAQEIILESVRKSWTGALSTKILEEAYGESASEVKKEIEIADQLAALMVTSDQISGNPRLIKRFLNELCIREAVASSQGMTFAFDTLVKMQLFERCASSSAYNFLTKSVFESDGGKPEYFSSIEDALAKGEEYTPPDVSWKDSFIENWLKLKPTLADEDLRPLLHLSKAKVVTTAAYDELSQKAQDILEALLAYNSSRIDQGFIAQLKEVGEIEAEGILKRLARRARTDQFNINSLRRVVHIVKAFPSLAGSFIAFFKDIPVEKITPPLIPLIKEEVWMKDILKEWKDNPKTPQTVKNALEVRGGQ